MDDYEIDYVFEDLEVRRFEDSQDSELTVDRESSEFVEVETTVEELLISCVQARPALWNCRLPLKDRSKTIRDSLWLEIYREFGESKQFSLEFLSKKWRNLRDTYVRIKGELESLSKSGSARRKKMKWAFFDQLKFLDDSLKNVTISNLYEACSSRSTSTSAPSPPVPPPSPVPPPHASTDEVKSYREKRKTETAIIDALKSISSENEPPDVNPICLKISQILCKMPLKERTELEIKLLQTTYENANNFL